MVFLSLSLFFSQLPLPSFLSLTNRSPATASSKNFIQTSFRAKEACILYHSTLKIDKKIHEVLYKNRLKSIDRGERFKFEYHWHEQRSRSMRICGEENRASRGSSKRDTPTQRRYLRSRSVGIINTRPIGGLKRLVERPPSQLAGSSVEFRPAGPEEDAGRARAGVGRPGHLNPPLRHVLPSILYS